jgi:hypothetical protein
MNTDLEITVNKSDLVKKLVINRDKHLKAYEKTRLGWESALRKELAGMLSELNKTHTIKIKPGGYISISNQKPQHYLDSYDEAIDMLKYGNDETITLNAEQYQRYIKDNWGWSGAFAATNSTYSRRR